VFEPSPKRYDHYRKRTPKKQVVMSSESDSEEEEKPEVVASQKVEVVDSSSSEEQVPVVPEPKPVKLSKTVQDLRSLKMNETIVLLSLFCVLSTQVTQKALLDRVQDQCNYFLRSVLAYPGLRSTDFREIVERLQKFGFVGLADTLLELNVSNGDFVAAFSGPKGYEYVKELAESEAPLNKLFVNKQ